MTQSHWGLPSGGGQNIFLLLSFFVSSAAVAFACLVDLHVAIIKASAIDDLFFKSTIFIFSVLASSRAS